MLKNSKIIISAFLAFLLSISIASAVSLEDIGNTLADLEKSVSGKITDTNRDEVEGPSKVGDIAGQPVFVWDSPIGEDIKNSSENRCKIIKTLKPGELLVMKTKHNTEMLLGRYATSLYVESIRTEYDIDKEKAVAQVHNHAEQELVNREILSRMASIATRLNVVASLEARNAALDNILKLSRLGGYIFSEYQYDTANGTCNIPSVKGD